VFATFDLCILGYAFSSFEMDTIWQTMGHINFVVFVLVNH
jgi:hypothetical protein